MLHFQKFCMQIHCVQNSGAFLLLVSITDNIYIHRLLYAKSLSLNFRKFVVFVTVYARYICSARTRNLRNLRIALRKLGIRTLARNPGIAQPIQLLRTRDVAQTYDL